MALSGSVTTSDYENRSVTFNWSATQDISNNKSTISWNLVGSGSASGYYVVSELRITVDGVEKYYRDTSNHTNCYNGTTLASGSFELSHSNDGTKSFTVKVEAGIYNWEINKSGSNTFTLDTIPRSSIITNAADITLEDSCSITWTPASSSYTFKLKFSLGSWSYTTGTISPAGTSTYTYTGYTIPLTVANQLPNSTSGTMTVYLYTYNGSTQIGSTTSDTFVVTIPESVRPKVKSLSVTLVNSNSVIDGWGIAVTGYTKLKITATAEGSYGSTISSFKITGIYNETKIGTSLSYTGDVVSWEGDRSIIVAVKDSRGRSSNSYESDTITFYKYYEPKIISFKVSRNSTQVTAIADWSYASMNGNNVVTAILYYKKTSDTSWTKYGTLPKHERITLTTEFDETASYNFKVVTTDSLSGSAQEEAFISTVAVTMDFRSGGKGIGIGKIAESDNLEIAFDTIFIGDVYIQADDGTKTSLDDYIKSLIT